MRLLSVLLGLLPQLVVAAEQVFEELLVLVVDHQEVAA